MRQLRAIIIVSGSSQIRAAYRLGDFAAELHHYLSVAVTVQEDPPAQGTTPAPTLLTTAGVLRRILNAGNPRELARRTVVINAARTRAIGDAEQFGLAAAVDLSTYLHWKHGGHTDSPAYLYGRKSVAVRLAARSVPDALPDTRRYTAFGLPDHKTLPALLAAYLKAVH